MPHLPKVHRPRKDFLRNLIWSDPGKDWIMKINRSFRIGTIAPLVAVLLSLTAAAAFAQQTTGAPGSPAATTAIDGPAASALPGRDQPERPAVEAGLAGARGAAEGRAEHP